MKRKEFDELESFTNLLDDKTKHVPCPDCDSYSTHPTPGCACRGFSGMERKPHIMKNHHTC